jgi:uncharacterized phage-associated protein
MAIHYATAAQRICARGNWLVTNLALQKILYLSQMVHMGEHSGARLVDATFQAWDYGPVVVDLYQSVKFFGNQPIQAGFFNAPVIDGMPEAATIDSACDFLLQKSAGELVAMTHWKDGAWAHNYRPNIKGIIIPDSDIIAEYHARTCAQ